MSASLFRRYHPISWVLIAVGLLAAGSVLLARHRVERGNRGVELAIDFVQLRQLGLPLDVTPAEALRRLHAAGVTGTILTEETPADLKEEGALFVHERWIDGADGKRTRVTLVEIADPELFARMREFMAHKLRTRFTTTPTSSGLVLKGTAGELFLPARWADVRGIGIGLNPEQVAIARTAGMDIIGRVANFAAAAPRSIDWVLHQAASQGCRVVIFSGDEVLGFRNELKTTAAALDGTQLIYGSVEFGKQRGDEGLSRALRSRLVRVHSITSAELVRLTPAEAAERFAKAVRERNIRVAYLRLFDQAGENPLEDNIAYVRSLSGELGSAGFVMSKAEPFAPMLPPRGSHPLAAVAVAGAAVLLAASVVPISLGRQVALALLFAVACAGLAVVGGDMGRKVMALGAAVLFPTLAFTLIPIPTEPELAEAGGSVSPVGRFALMSALTFAGGLLVAGIMSQNATLVKVTEFSGIKLAHVLPLFLVAAVYVASAFNTGDWAEEQQRIGRRLRAFFGAPILTWQSAAAVVALVALALLVLRSGNDAGVEVSQMELRFRGLLDRYLVRPRTKEFLVGHPALWCALFFAAWGWRGRWLIPLLLVGAIGQVGMLNSFCHLHTPIALSIVRGWNGLWLGTLLGCAAAAVIRAGVNRWNRATGKPSPRTPAEEPAALKRAVGNLRSVG